MSVQHFEAESALPVSADDAFAWHARPGALQRLTPPWQRVRVVSSSTHIRDGARVELELSVGPLRRRWLAEHRGYVAGREFRDVSIRGPFPHWEHTHSFIPGDRRACALRDSLSYRLPGGMIGAAVGGGYVRRQLRRLFRYRHAVARLDLAMHAQYREVTPLVVAVSGASGLIGGALAALLTTGGHRVIRLVRHPARGPDELEWRPEEGVREPQRVEDIDAIIHLAGENIAAHRWTPDMRARIRASRVDAVRALVRSLARAKRAPAALLSASAIGYYGDRGDERLNESSPPGATFLAKVAEDWEREALAAGELGMRAAVLRIGVVLTPAGGALARVLPIFSLGLGGPIGHGRQYISWISLDDVIGALHHVLMRPDLSGPINLVAPAPATNAEFAAALGRVLQRPALIPAPAAAVRFVLGQVADETVLASARVAPEALLRSGYAFRHSTLEAALRHVLGRPAPEEAT